MQFKGQLLLPGDSGPGLSVNLDVAEHHLAVESEGGGLGAWPLEVVDVERLESDLFALTVAGELLRFVADDSIAFAYTGIPTIERVGRRRPRPRSGFRSLLDRIRNVPDEKTPTGLPTEPGARSGEDRVAEGQSSNGDMAPITGDVEETDHGLFDTPLADEGDQADPPPELETTEIPGVTDEVSDTQCRAVRSDGRRCESPILTSSGYCYPHDPKRAFDDKYKAAQEARARIKQDATGRLNRIYGRLDKAMRQVERGELDPEIAMAMAQIARTMCAILDVEESQDHGRA